MKKPRTSKSESLVVREVDARTWTVQKKAVPGFRLSKSTMAAAKTTARRNRGSVA